MKKRSLLSALSAAGPSTGGVARRILNFSRMTTSGSARVIVSAVMLSTTLPVLALDPPVPAAQQGLPQNWERLLDSTNGEGLGRSFGCNSDRFACVMQDAGGMYQAVRDNETGLVWDREPPQTIHTWDEARERCTSSFTGGRRGWRLPSIHELASLHFHVPISGAVQLPTNHPFLGVQAASYWSATTSAINPELAWRAGMSNTSSATFFKWTRVRVWCVRGGANYTVY